MGIREDVLALADELEAFEGYTCERCAAYEQPECGVYLPCTEIVSKYCARLIREAVERDGEGATTVSAYDLLGDDDRKALAWVREMGGIERCEAFVHQGAMEHGYLLKIAHALGTSIYDGTDNADDLLEKLSERLMPEGMEWPRFEDGEKLTLDNAPIGVEGVEFPLDASGYALCCGVGPKRFRFCERVERVNRPAPEVLDGEGATTVSAYDLLGEDEREAIAWVREHGGLGAVEKRLMPEGMEWPKVDGKPVDFKTVYVPSLGVLEAVSIYNNGACQVMSHDGIIKSAKDIHIEKPEVLDADGVEIRVGDTVYVLGFGEPLTVKGFTDDGRVLMSFHSENALGYKPSNLTHEQPDTWERLEHDAEKTVCEYFGANYDCANCPLEPARCDEEAKKDIIRRAKKLAERGA